MKYPLRTGLAMLVTGVLLMGCSSTAVDCESFNAAFDDLAQAQQVAATKINTRGICHTQDEDERRAECPEYYDWLAAATNFATFIATDKTGCTTPEDRTAALADLEALTKPAAFPKN